MDQLKAEIEKMRDAVNQGEKKEKTEAEAKADKYLSTRSRDLCLTGSSAAESAATRLQQAHDDKAKMDSQKVAHSVIESKLEVPLSSSQDFPPLSKARPDLRLRTDGHSLTEDASTPESRQCGGHGTVSAWYSSSAMTNTALHDSGCSSSPRGHGYQPLPSATTASTASSTAALLGGETSPADAGGSQLSNSVSRGIPLCQKGSPHFAQPTEAFARKTVSHSPVRSIRASALPSPTEKLWAQRTQKRKSLPGDWLNASSQSIDEAEAAGPTVMERKVSSHIDADGWQLMQNTHYDEDGASKSIRLPTDHSKRRSTLFAPTAASMQRTVATLGRENLKHTAPRVKENPSTPKSASPATDSWDSGLSSEPTSLILTRKLEAGMFGLDGTHDILKSENVDRIHDEKAVRIDSKKDTPSRGTDSCGQQQPAEVSKQLPRSKVSADRTAPRKSPTRIPRPVGWLPRSPATKSEPSRSAMDLAELTKYSYFGKTPLKADKRLKQVSDAERSAILDPIKRKLYSAGLLKPSEPPLTTSRLAAQKVRANLRAKDANVKHTVQAKSTEHEQRTTAKAVDEPKYPPKRPQPAETNSSEKDDTSVVRAIQSVEDIFLHFGKGSLTVQQPSMDRPYAETTTMFKETFRKTSSNTTLGSRKFVETVVTEVPKLVIEPTDSPSAKLLRSIQTSAIDHKVGLTQKDETALARENDPPPVAAERKISADPSIVYTGRKPSGGSPPEQDPAVLACGPMRVGARQPSVSSVKTLSGTLRATAPAFTPMWRPQSAYQEAGYLSWTKATPRSQPYSHPISAQAAGYRHNLPSVEQALRARGYMANPGPVPHGLTNDSLRQKSIDGIWDGRYASAQAPLHDEDNTPSLQQPSPLASYDGSPSKKSVFFSPSNEVHDGPRTFGRAPPPRMTIPTSLDLSTPSISPTSTVTISPEKTPSGSGAWAIQSPFYGWHGGDGQEIKFLGHGPDAERNPNIPISLVKTDGVYDLTPREASSDQERSGFSPPIAPKKMRQQWAVKMGYPMVPCGNMNITDAVEEIGGFGCPPTVGWCHSCVPAH